MGFFNCEGGFFMFGKDMTIKLFEDKIRSLEKQLEDANAQLKIYKEHEAELDRLKNEYFESIELVKKIRDRYAEEIEINENIHKEYRKEFERLIKKVS